jgi:hypothetical protein
MNPARTLSTAIPAGMWNHVWIYLTAPTLGMALAAVIYEHLAKPSGLVCAKLLHPDSVRCIHCGFEPSEINK